MQKTQIKIPIQLLAELEYSPCMETYFKLKIHNKSGHYKIISSKYIQIAKELNISLSRLRKHVKALQENGFVEIKDNTLRLVSIWRNPAINKNRKHTTAHYKQISKMKINPNFLKLEMAQAKLSTQLKRQKYKAKQSTKKIFKKDSIRSKAKNLVNQHIQNGNLKNVREQIYFNNEITNKEVAFDRYRSGLNLVSMAIATYNNTNEGKSINKSQSIGQTKIAEILGVKSVNTVKKRLSKLEAIGVLNKERDKVRMVKYKKFNINKHFCDKFGNIYNKECYRYEVRMNNKDMALYLRYK